MPRRENLCMSTPLSPPVTFRAKPVTGAGRGKKLDVPTINIDPSILPKNFPEGVYAAKVWLDDDTRWKMGAMHYGPRPVFNDSLSLEVHILDATISALPGEIAVETVARLRDVQNFPSVDALKTAIDQDILDTRAILGHS